MDDTFLKLGRSIGSMTRIVRVTAEYISAFLFAALFAAFIAQIFMRFIMNSPLNWTEELSVISYMWIVFLACSFMLKDNQHVSFTIITHMLSDRGRHICAMLSSLVLVVILCWVTYGIYDYVSFMKIEVTPALMIRKDYVYSVFVVFILALILRYIWTLFLSFLALGAADKYSSYQAGFAETSSFEPAHAEAEEGVV
jgi:TRAP-type C4-dicarboxylate transport system, small permease component